jgi:hypothetical protein
MKNQPNNYFLSKRANQRLFAEKIAHYAQRRPKHFLQIDGIFAAGRYDEQTPIDIEGDFIEASKTVELMNGSDVRVLIPDGTNPKVAIRHLKKMAKLLKVNPKLMDYAKPDLEDTQAYEDNDIPF